MKGKIFIAIFVFWAATINANNDTIKKLFERANKYYEQKNYYEAIELYERILKYGYYSKEIYFNLGNCYFKTKNIPYSILYYEKAKKLAPFNQDIKNNLELANILIKSDDFVSDDFILDKIYLWLINLTDSNTWAILAFSSFIVFLSMLAILLFSKSYSLKRKTFFLSVFFIIFTFFNLTLSYLNYSNLKNSKTAILVENSVLKSSPSDIGTDLYLLNAGVKLKITSEQDQWYEVVLQNSTKGWIKKSSVEKI